MRLSSPISSRVSTPARSFSKVAETGGFSGREVEEQMQAFAEEVAPELRRACGGGPKREESTVSFDDVRPDPLVLRPRMRRVHRAAEAGVARDAGGGWTCCVEGGALTDTERGRTFFPVRIVPINPSSQTSTLPCSKPGGLPTTTSCGRCWPLRESSTGRER